MRIVAILASYNEARFMRACLEHYERQGVDVYLLDNDSSDDTVAIAREFLGRNLLGIETIPRRGMYEWVRILLKKEELADRLEADWYLHADPDEIRLAPSSGETLAEAIARVDAEGYNAINFMEYTFLPVRESPDHDHADFQQTMKWYYPFGPRHPHRLNAWKRQPRRRVGLVDRLREFRRYRRWSVPSVDLHSHGGHRIDFPGLRMYPEDFKLKHYLVLSLDHAIEKYVEKDFKAAEVAGSHGWRATAGANDLLIPSSAQMRQFSSDDALDSSSPLTEHLVVKTAAQGGS